MLDPDHRHALFERADQVDQKADLGFGQAARDLVQQQQFGPNRQSPRQLQPLAVEQRQHPRHQMHLRCQSGALDHLLGRARRMDPAQAGPESGRGQHVFEHRQIGKRLRNLIGSGNAHVDPPKLGHVGDIDIAQYDLSAVPLDRAVDQIEERRFPRSIGADHTQAGVGCERQTDRIGDDDAAEALVQFVNAQDVVHFRRCSFQTLFIFGRYSYEIAARPRKTAPGRFRPGAVPASAFVTPTATIASAFPRS